MGTRKEIRINVLDTQTFASLIDLENDVCIMSATAKYNPNDAKENLSYSFETGAKLALDRLFEKMTEAEPKSEPFDWEAFSKGKLAVHCETEIEAKRFLRACKKRGYEWIDIGDDLAKDTCFNRGKEKTCYRCADYGCYSRKGIVFGNLDYYKSQNTKIVKYAPEVREVKRQAKVGEWIKFTWYDSDCIELAGKIGKVLEVGNSEIEIEHEKVWEHSEESRKGFETTTFANTNIKYVVLEGCQEK